jgi:hypothetical protein
LTKLGLYDLRQHKPWFDEECSRFLDRRKQATAQWLQHPNHNHVGNMNKLRLGDSRHFRKGNREYLTAKVDELETNSKVKNIRCLFGGINEYKNCYKPRPNIESPQYTPDTNHQHNTQHRALDKYTSNHHLNTPHNTNRQSPEFSEHQNL